MLGRVLRKVADPNMSLPTKQPAGAGPTVLILDDQEAWLGMHERRLSGHGYACVSTQRSDEAIRLAVEHRSIQFAVIDEILLVPSVRGASHGLELQRHQGRGVVKELAKKRPDLRIAYVTEAPHARAKQEEDASSILEKFGEEEGGLLSLPGVVRVFHKDRIDKNPDREYAALFELVDEAIRGQSSQSQSTERQVVVVGYGVDPPILEQAREMQEDEAAASRDWDGSSSQQIQRERGRAKTRPGPQSWIRLRDYAKLLGKACDAPSRLNPDEIQDPDQLLRDIIDNADKAIFLWRPETDEVERLSSIRSGTQSFRILELLVAKAEKGEAVSVCEGEYEYRARTTGPPTVRPNQPAASAELSAFEHLQDGMSIISGPPQRRSTPFPTAVSRLNEKLVGAGVRARSSGLPLKLGETGTVSDGYFADFQIQAFLIPSHPALDYP